MSFAYLRDPLFLICVAAYGLNRFAEHVGTSHWLLRGYLNDLVCIAFWLPILVFVLRWLGLRRSDVPPEKHEIAIVFAVWSVMFEVWLPHSSLLGNLISADPWDIVCYAIGGVLASFWWDWYYVFCPKRSLAFRVGVWQRSHIMNMTLDILYEDNHLLVINKPAGIATMGAESGETVHSQAAEYLKHKYHKPGNVFVGIVSRLDAMTSGVMVLARTSKAASRLVPQFGDSGQGKKAADVPRAVKVYLAAVEGRLENDHGQWIDYVRKDDAAQRMRIVDETAKGAQRAELEYRKLADADSASIVAVRLSSGRKHQIRLQFADRGYPILGDRKYDSDRKFAAGVALHSWCLQITHPTQRRRYTWYADLPRSWKSLTAVMPPKNVIAAMVDDRFGLHVSQQQDQPQADDCEETK